MPILNYTTKIDAGRTVGEIQRILAGAGAGGIYIDYDEQRQPAALEFFVTVNTQPTGFRLPSRWRGVLARLEGDPGVPKHLRSEAQARRVAWRIVKDWTEAQLAIIDAGLAELAEVFLPYAVNPNSGRTLFDEFKDGQFLLSAGQVEGGSHG